MHTKRNWFAAGAVLAAAAVMHAADAQPVVIRVDYLNGNVVDTRVANNADATINLDGDPTTQGLQPLQNSVNIRVFDDVGTSAPGVPNPPVHSVGSLTINGSVDPNVPGVRLSVLVAANTVTATPDDPSLDILQALSTLVTPRQTSASTSPTPRSAPTPA